MDPGLPPDPPVHFSVLSDVSLFHNSQPFHSFHSLANAFLCLWLSSFGIFCLCFTQFLPSLSFIPSSCLLLTLLQESQKMQTKLDALTREVFDLQETINWKDKKIGVGGPTWLLWQNMGGKRWSLLSRKLVIYMMQWWRVFPSWSFAFHAASAWWRPVSISTNLNTCTFSLEFCMLK